MSSTKRQMYYQKIKENETRDCLDPWKMILINNDGSVRMCCWMEEIGNINQEPLETIINGPKIETYREALLGKADLPWECATCPAKGVITTSELRKKVEVEKSVALDRELSSLYDLF